MASFLERWLLWSLLRLLFFPCSRRLLAILRAAAAAVLVLLLWWEYLWGMAVISASRELLPAAPEPNGEGRSEKQLENSVRAVLLFLWVFAEVAGAKEENKGTFVTPGFERRAFCLMTEALTGRNIWTWGIWKWGIWGDAVSWTL